MSVIDPVLEETKAVGTLDVIDPHFGMVWTNIPIDYFVKLGIDFGDKMRVIIEHNNVKKYSEILKYCKTFSDVEKNEELVYNNEIGNIAIATNFASFTEKFNILTGIEWKVTFGTI